MSIPKGSTPKPPATTESKPSATTESKPQTTECTHVWEDIVVHHDEETKYDSRDGIAQTYTPVDTV